MFEDKKKCIARTKGDFRCSLPCAKNALADSDYCKHHDPRFEDERKLRAEAMRQDAIDNRRARENAYAKNKSL